MMWDGGPIPPGFRARYPPREPRFHVYAPCDIDIVAFRAGRAFVAPLRTRAQTGVSMPVVVAGESFLDARALRVCTVYFKVLYFKVGQD